MRCIFCKSRSDNSVSVEHILPESLGNTEHILPRGWVCDKCNNYFSREIEKPFLDSVYGTYSRFEMAVPNKRGRIPPVKAFHPQSRTVVHMFQSEEGLCFAPADEKDLSRLTSALQSNESGSLYIPTAGVPEPDFITSRFIAKIALEALAARCIEIDGWNDQIVDTPELDEIRRYVRLGGAKSVWPVHIRQIYAADFKFDTSAHGPHQVLHEWTILYIGSSEDRGRLSGEFYAVIAIFGLEYSINLGGPELDGYYNWLKSHQNRSPLYDQGIL